MSLTYKGLELPEHIHRDFFDNDTYYTIDWATLEKTPLDIEEWYKIQMEYTQQTMPCDCGGWTCGTHSHWCQNKLDNRKRIKGIEDKRNWRKES